MELDEAYSNADHIPGGDGFVAYWASRATAFREAMGDSAVLDQPYGDGVRLRYDLFLPEGSPKGTVVFVHGGYWKALDKSSWSHLAAGPLVHGWAVAMPSYDLCPTVTIPEITQQIARAVERIGEHVPGPLSLTGHSAGGQLVARMLDRSVLPTATQDRVQAVAPISPLSDLRPLLKTSMRADLRLDDAQATTDSPILMHDRANAETAVWVGGAERPAFLDQARWLGDAWTISVHVVPEKHHFDIIDLMEDPKSDLVRHLTA